MVNIVFFRHQKQASLKESVLWKLFQVIDLVSFRLTKFRTILSSVDERMNRKSDNQGTEKRTKLMMSSSARQNF